MRITSLHNKNYTELNQGFQLVLPLSLEGLIPEDDSVRLLSHILEGLDYTELYKAYSSTGRNPAVEPQTMFKIMTYAYSQNVYSTRKIETSCRRDINFRWLLAGQKAPDHATISRFRSHYLSDGIIDQLFYQMVLALYDTGEIQFENAFIDGTKIEANANKYTFVWKKVILKNEDKMFEKIEKLISEINLAEIKEFFVGKDTAIQDLETVLSWLNSEKSSRNIEFVHGIGKRKTEIQKWMEQLEEFKDRKVKYDASKELMKSRNSYSKTDKDATFMHMKDDHMRNSQLKPGYNVQIAVESEYVTGVEIFQDRNDVATLIPMLNGMLEKLGRKYTNVIADSGYESEENYRYLGKEKITPYVKPQTYEIWKKKSFKQDIKRFENMRYLEEADAYVCANDRILWPIGIHHKKSGSGYRSRLTVYECEDCSECAIKSKCTKAQGNRRMELSKTFVEERKKSYENIMTKQGIKLRVNRSIQVEGAFGVLKHDYDFNRFLTRGKNNVKTEFMLLCLGYNINKLHAKIQNERIGKHLHSVKESA
jgi:transposase